MDRTDEFRAIVKRILMEVEAMLPSEGDVTTELVRDDSRGHYQLGQVGWDGKRRVDDIFLHVDVVDGKAWIQHDGTNLRLAEMLVKEGIPKECIVLAFHRPDLRVYTEYAVA
jgi:hypothetical protein